MPEYERIHAGEVIDITSKLINSHHTHLQKIRFCYLWQFRGDESGGWLRMRPVLAYVTTVTGVLKAFTDCHVIMTIDRDEWELLTSKQRVALIDHELCHVKCNEEEKKVYIVDHDVEEFTDIAVRHGAWSSRFEEFAEKLTQRNLEFSDA